MVLSSIMRSCSKNKAISTRHFPLSSSFPREFCIPCEVLVFLRLQEATCWLNLFLLPASFWSFKVSSLKYCLIHLMTNLDPPFEGPSLPLIPPVSSPADPRLIASLLDSLTMTLICSSQFPSTAFNKYSFLIKASSWIIKQKWVC